MLARLSLAPPAPYSLVLSHYERHEESVYQVALPVYLVHVKTAALTVQNLVPCPYNTLQRRPNGR